VLLQLTAAYQPTSTATLNFKDTTTGVAPGNAMARLMGITSGASASTSVSGLGTDYKSSHSSVGVMLNLKAFVAVGAGVEYRFEKYESAGVDTTYTRPCVRFNAGWSLPSPFIKPFIGVEADFPISSKSMADNASTKDTMLAIAPKTQIGVYGGIRF